MRHRLAIFALLALACAAGVSAAAGEQVRRGNLEVTFNAGFNPQALPRSRPGAVTVTVEAGIGTTDGSRPPALRSFELQLNSHGRIDAHGLPVCRSSELQSVPTEAALARCRGALVGHGSFRAEVESSESKVPASGRILVFNGRRHGHPLLLLHLYGTVPVRASFVLPLAIQHRGKHELGTLLAANVPLLASGLGSITSMKMTIGRTFSYRGRRHSYLGASCAAPKGWNVVPFFPFARGVFDFVDGMRLQKTLERSCRVRSSS
ncbi:MAG TPA: hypothetical protein VMT37_04315 [Solirubrobacterales bacterium]|nr:hypothetical protein [Solirubrobacterales bacterium]